MLDEKIYDSDGSEINLGDSVILRRDSNQSPTIRRVDYIIRRGYNKGQVRMVNNEQYLWCHSRYLLKVKTDSHT